MEFEREITMHGNSMTIKITKEARAMGLDSGDFVKVKLTRIPDPEVSSEGLPVFECTDCGGEGFTLSVESVGSHYSVRRDDGTLIGEFPSVERAEWFIENAYPDAKRV